MTTSTRSGLAEDIVISIVVFLVVSLRNTAGTEFQGANSFVVLRYLEKLYEFDIDNILIRSQSAPYGWLWSRRYEAAVINQVQELLNPIVNCMKANQLDDIEARCLAIWSVYYVGFRNAVVHHFTAKECTESISSSIKVVLKK